MNVRLTPRAAKDLVEIRAYLMRQSPQGAESVRLAVLKCIAAIARFPNYGQSTSNPRIRLMATPKYPYQVYFALERTTIAIVHIRHTSRKPPESRDLS